MNDLISRQAAIDVLMEILDRPNHAEFLYTDEICKALKALPSAQPVAKDINVPAKDCISRQAAIDALGEPPVVLWEYMDDYTLGTRNQYDKDRLAIESVPTIDAVPVKHGRWIYHPDWQADGECGYECSACGMGSDVDYQFCMSCGARMDGKEGDQNG